MMMVKIVMLDQARDTFHILLILTVGGRVGVIIESAVGQYTFAMIMQIGKFNLVPARVWLKLTVRLDLAI